MATITCSKCGARSETTQLVCVKCGAMLLDPANSTVHMRVDPALLRLHRNRQETKTAPVITARTVLLQIRGLTERLVFEERTEFVLGRLDLSQPTARRYELTRFGAHERGVSREHARLSFKNYQLTVTDLGSVNGTTVNLKRLAPHEPHVLSSGDELMLSRLSIVLRFEAIPDPRLANVRLDDDTKPTRFPDASKPAEAVTPPLTALLDPAKLGRSEGSAKIDTKEVDNVVSLEDAPTEKGRPADMPSSAALAALQDKMPPRPADTGAAAPI